MGAELGFLQHRPALRGLQPDTFVLATTGIDFHGQGRLPRGSFRRGGKTRVTASEQLELVRRYKIKLSSDRSFVSQTGTHFAIGLEALFQDSRLPHNGRVIVAAPLSRTDVTSEMIETAFNDANVILQGIFSDEPNAKSVVIKHRRDKHIWVNKPESIPTINLFPETAGTVVFSSLGGDWDETYHLAREHADKTGAKRVVIGSETQIRELFKPENKAKKIAYILALEGAAAAFFNLDEARLLVQLFGEKPKRNPKRLALQLQEIYNIAYLSITNGYKGDTITTPEKVVSELRTRKLPKRQIKSTTGMGDASAAGGYFGLFIGDTLQSTHINRARSARRVGTAEDGLSMQLRGDEWIYDAQAKDFGWSYATYTAQELSKPFPELRRRLHLLLAPTPVLS